MRGIVDYMNLAGFARGLGDALVNFDRFPLNGRIRSSLAVDPERAFISGAAAHPLIASALRLVFPAVRKARPGIEVVRAVSARREGTRWESGTVPQRYAGTNAVISTDPVGVGKRRSLGTPGRVWACESEDLPIVPGAPRPAAHRPWDGRTAEWVCVLGRWAIGFAPEGNEHAHRTRDR